MKQEDKIIFEKYLKEIGEEKKIEEFFKWAEDRVYHLTLGGWMVVGYEDFWKLHLPDVFLIFFNYEKEQRDEKLNKFSQMFEKTFGWEDNEKANFLYANTIYSIISENETHKAYEQLFLDYMNENGIF